MPLIEQLSKQLGLSSSQVEAVLALLEEGATIPFIARYRKEKTGNLDEDAIRAIEEQYAYQVNLRKRKDDVLRLIEEKGLLTDALRIQLAQCTRLSEVEDLYRPYKEKKKTKASAAIAAGFEPLAQAILDAPNKDPRSLVQSHDVDTALEQAGYIIAERIARQWIRFSNAKNAPFLQACIQDAMKRLLMPAIKREIRSALKETADQKAIATFATNLEHLLMTRPIKQKRVLGFDPAFRTGCKLAVLDENGTMLETAVIYPTAPHNDFNNARKTLGRLIDQYGIELIAIGNGTASRESEQFVARVLKDFPQVQYLLVSEAGASVYSASKLAQEEFPDLTVEKRSAISIGRRVQDPLSELVKIDPKSIGIGEYQHDVNQKLLSNSLDFTTEKIVNQVGVNVNTASKSILKYVSGLNKRSIEALYEAKTKHPITSRAQIAQIKGISTKTYEQCVGFLRIPESADPLDNTGIHPESYPIARHLLEKLHLDLADLGSRAFQRKLAVADTEKLAAALRTDVFTLKDIVKELSTPGLDPRDALDAPLLKHDVLTMKDLRRGMKLEGTVRNVVSFGAFVDIGLHEDGLVHISKLSRSFVKDPNDVVHVGDIVTCYVESVDEKKARIALSMVELSS
ncbi:Tex-like N-terminal domain-containing protein [uncultured Dubosiella sp.]|uniref:Tex-like N-terminal domain-containing protein n=1 Tax=uncultured Dubosiella sp. TaxID=1937011 RepID=UPI0025B3A065|nr:Tex family protein [uncultured Dubosiella sp.]